MKLIKTVLGYDDDNNRLPDIVLDENCSELVIQSGEAFFVIRDFRPETLVITHPGRTGNYPIRRQTIEPIGDGAFWVTQHVIHPTTFRDAEEGRSESSNSRE